MKHNFDSVTQAIEAGYESPGRAGRILHETETHDIIITDTSGPNSFGYSFGIMASPKEDAIREGHRRGPVTDETVTVWTNDLNQLGQPGSFRPMFEPGVLSAAIAMAEASVA